MIASAAQMSRDRSRFTFVRCRACALVYLSPRVAPGALAAYYGADYLPHRGAAAWGRWRRWAEEGQRRTDARRVRLARLAVRLEPGTEVVDVGCGRPTFLEMVVRGTGCRGTGIDPSDLGWSGEPERWRAAGLRLIRGRLDEVEAGGPFDLVTLWHALEHDYDPIDTLRRLSERTREGGALVVEVPDYDSLTRRLHGASWAGFHTPRHSAAYTPATLKQILERAGWRVERQATHGTLDPYVLWWLGRQERLGRPLEGSLEPAFPRFLLGKLLTLPVAAAQRWLRLGVQTAVARKDRRSGRRSVPTASA